MTLPAHEQPNQPVEPEERLSKRGELLRLLTGSTRRALAIRIAAVVATAVVGVLVAIIMRPPGQSQYLEGKSLMQNPNPAGVIKAADLYDQACQKGNANACAALAPMLRMGVGPVREDKPRAFALYERACDLGAADGCNGAGVCLESGECATQDYQKAAEYYQRACKHWDFACGNLGSLYVRGLGVPVDLDRAARLLEMGCANKDEPNKGACYNLGIRYKNGEGVPRDVNRSRELFRKACVAGMSMACDRLNAM